MRLRLQISRHALPDTRLLWQVKTSRTISQLLQLIDQHYPLESSDWGLEDYVVSVAGFEALHYHLVGDVFKDDDHVTVRPLETNEVKQRRILGRDQIAASGMHLLDGLPFGKSKNTDMMPTRPPIHIPPRHGQRLELDDQEWEHQEGRDLDEPLNERQLVLMPDVDDDDDDDDDVSYQTDTDQYMSDDADSETKELEHNEANDLISDMDREHESTFDRESSWEGIESPVTGSGGQLETQTFNKTGGHHGITSPKIQEASVLMPPLQDRVASHRYQPSDNALGSDVSDESSSDDSDESSSDDSSEANSEDSSSEDGDHESGNDDEANEGPDLLSSKNIPPEHRDILLEQAPPGQQATPPFAGQKRTKARNERRRDLKKLIWLKKQGRIHKDADIEALKEWKAIHESPSIRGSGDEMATDAMDSSPAVDHDDPPTKSGPAPTDMDFDSEIQRKRQELLAAIESGGVDVTSTHGTPDETHQQSTSIEGSATPSDMPARRKTRLDLSGSQRMVLGALGVRVPKTEEERTKLQAKLAKSAQRVPVKMPAPTTSEPRAVIPDSMNEAAGEMAAEVVESHNAPDATHPDYWRSKIHLSAVECCADAPYQVISTPPFPFYQNWDAAQRPSKKRKRRNGGGGCNKRAQLDYNYDEEYAYTNEEGNEAYDLSYDHDNSNDMSGFEAETDDPASAQLLTEATLSQHDADGPEDEHDGNDHDDNENNELQSIPELPSDLTSLPLIKRFQDLAVGQLITYSVLEVSSATKWQPAISPIRTARVWSLDGIVHSPTVTLLVAKRDMSAKKYDEQGRRVYDKFEMPVHDDDDGDGDEGDDDFPDTDDLHSVSARINGEKNGGSTGPEEGSTTDVHVAGQDRGSNEVPDMERIKEYSFAELVEPRLLCSWNEYCAWKEEKGIA